MSPFSGEWSKVYKNEGDIVGLDLTFYPKKTVFVILISILVSEFTIQSAVPSGHEDSEFSKFLGEWLRFKIYSFFF